MIATYKSIARINFPCFILPSENWSWTDGLLYIDGYLVDDRNCTGDTLGIRRLQTPFRELMPLKKSVTTHLGLIKSGKKYFLDSKGNPFIYEKTKMCKLVYYKIKRVDRKEVASIMWLYGIKRPFSLPRPPKQHYSWVGVLELNGNPWLLYEYSGERKPTSRRKV